MNMNQTCSDCALGLRQIELSSPFGYNAKEAAQFASSTSACNASGYGLTSPTPYALKTTSTASVTSSTHATPTCVSKYTLQPSDSCSSVSRANNVSTYSLLASNGLRADCTNFPSANSTLCIPPKCTTYTVKSYDTCRSILDQHHGISNAQFISWNPNINSLCGNLYLSVGKEICVRSVRHYIIAVPR
jgi:LysM repeat protein